MLRTGVILSLFTAIGVSLIAMTSLLTQEKIAANDQAMLQQQIESVLAPYSYNNSILEDKIQVFDPELLGSKQLVTVYRARQDNLPIAAVFTPIAPNGYNGAIRLLVGINHQGMITGVRVIDHHETPGLGDKIELEKSPWVLSFNNHSFSYPSPDRWAVKKDGGDFDQFTGATITPRAIVQAVYRCLEYFDLHQQDIFTTPLEE
ncbi:electron transport complex subunit RsxG [Candidatus Nitrosacidococcus sp. I8]|uniref:electron transport complex subunit RsxG n=1 Tax=Candidatus Nitrosacidococcus sp. I8 TaxID=2942908 RepID=UPI00222668AB|nr:electron transport complex subunit RsxG [Candidatus Nitrosacidococcus sp. I8]CAH9018305.1 Ion-translocating oxidoreductase complex subunit G [Candidatus Nitrosacidococcus sp. I8]